MPLVDTHAHLYLEAFKADIAEVIARAQQVDVEKIYMPNIDVGTIDPMLALAQQYPNYCIPMMGLHPCSVGKDFEKQLYEIEGWLSQRPFAAVGEIGTDLHWDRTWFEAQKEAFSIQSRWAIQHDIPIVVHCRDSMDETIALVEALKTERYRGVFHCFNGTVDQAHRIIDLGFMLGIGGVATFKNGGMTPVLQAIDLKRLVLETDSPYLSPAPHRGKRNEPAYLTRVVEQIAWVKSMTPEEVAQVTTQNAARLFQTSRPQNTAPTL